MAKRKIAEKDFLESDLPQTRKKQFFEILKNNYLTIFIIGLILLGATSLLIIKSFAVDYFNVASSKAVELGNLAKEERDYWIKIIFLISNALDIIIYPIIFIILAGVLRIYREYLFSDGVLFSYLFKKGVKNNYKQFLLMGIITGFIKLGSNALITFYGANVFSIIVIIFFVVIYLPIVIIYLYYSTIYTSNLLISLRNSIYVFMKTPWQTILFTIVLFGGVISLEFFFNFLYIKQIIYVVLATLLFPIAILAGFSLYLYFFDKYINVIDFPELIRMGLYIPNSEREELINQRLNKLAKRGDKDLTQIKNIVRYFKITGTDMTIFKELSDTDGVYDVEFDRRYKYIIYKEKDNSEEIIKKYIDDYENMEITPVQSKNNEDYVMIEEEKYHMVIVNKKRK